MSNIASNELIALCTTSYSVSILGNGNYFCNCKGAYTNNGYCSHSFALQHCEKKINIEEKLKKITCPRTSGRPKDYAPVGFAAHLPTIVRSEHEARKYIGTTVAKRFECTGDKVFTGRVDDCRFVGKTATVGYYAFHVTYPIQFEGDCEETEELTISEVRAGHRLYEDYRSRI
jgi:hypothetical protein